LSTPLRSAFLTSIAISAVITAAPVAAQDTAPVEEATPGSDDLHDTIVVTAAGLSRLDMLAGTSVMEGVELQRNLNGQIGEVLAHLPGVTASGFAPGVSRPVLRGFGGERVRVLTDGIGAIDASSTSDDHAVSVDPLIADRIEVLRGPAVLLYGSQAIGGAVNIITKRIPPRMPEEKIHIDASLAADTVANLREGGLSLDAPVGRNFAVHVDGSYHTTDDLEIPGYAATPGLRASMLAAADEEEEEGHLEEADELREGADTSDYLPNSWTRTWTAGAGAAWFSSSSKSSLGASFDYYDTNYGIPGLPGVGHVHEHEEGEEEDDHEDEHEDEEEHGEEDVSIAMKRYRADLRGTLDLGSGLFESVQTRWGWSDYTHTEFEGDEVGTVFDVTGVEGRVELVQAQRGGWSGSLGGQYSHVDFEAIGDEAFVPSTVTENFALFALQEVAFGPFEVELGGRYEHVRIDASDSLGLSRNFDTISGAVGVSYAVVENSLGDVRIGANGSRAERAPSAQELFADGPHVATQQYEIGDATLSTESSWGAEAYVRGNLGPVELSASVYRNWFDNFIYLAATGEEEDGLPAFAFAQSSADQFGLEGEVRMPVMETRAFDLYAELGGDYVRATLADGSPVPRIPPFSLKGALEVLFGHFDARAEVQWYDKQTRIAEYETPTDGYTMVNVSLAWHPLEGNENLTIMAQVDNVLDAEGRRHSSFTKEYTPLAGRNLRLSARASF